MKNIDKIFQSCGILSIIIVKTISNNLLSINVNKWFTNILYNTWMSIRVLSGSAMGSMGERRIRELCYQQTWYDECI